MTKNSLEQSHSRVPLGFHKTSSGIFFGPKVFQYFCLKTEPIKIFQNRLHKQDASKFYQFVMMLSNNSFTEICVTECLSCSIGDAVTLR